MSASLTIDADEQEISKAVAFAENAFTSAIGEVKNAEIA